jgi:hypothetical protein
MMVPAASKGTRRRTDLAARRDGGGSDGCARTGWPAHAIRRARTVSAGKRSGHAVPADGLLVDLGLAAAVDDDDGERRASGDEPVDQPDDRRRERGHHEKYKRLDAPERLAHAGGDVRLLRLIDQETAAWTDQEAVVGLEHIAAFGALERDVFETVVKPSHDPSSALQSARLLFGRTKAAGGSKWG